MDNQEAATIHSYHTTQATGQQSRYVFGLDIGGTNLRLALADFTGTILARRTVDLRHTPAVESVLQVVRETAESLLAQTAIARGRVVAIGAGAPGITDTEHGIVIATSYLLGWRNVPLQALLKDALHIPAAIENDVNLAALGELHAGAARGLRNFVFIAVGTGLGAGIVLNGELHHGITWSAGEIGYMLVPGASEAPAQRGEPGALESLVGGTGIQAQWRSHSSQHATSLAMDASPTEIFAAAVTGDALAAKVLARSAKALAYAIYNTSLVLNCRLFVLGGGVGSHPAFIARTQQHLDERNTRTPLTLACSALGPDAQLAGAIHLALRTAIQRNHS